MLLAQVVVDRLAIHVKGGLSPALALLHHMPGLMGQMRVLTWRQMGGAKAGSGPRFTCVKFESDTNFLILLFLGKIVCVHIARVAIVCVANFLFFLYTYAI